MANTIQIKRNTSGVPSGLAAGELAVNLSDNKLYVGNAAEDGVIHLNPSASGTLTSTGDFTIDSGDGIILDADGGAISLKDGGTRFGVLENSSSNFVIQNPIDDKDILFKIKDGGTVKTALTLDGSENGNATFGGTITATGGTLSSGTSGQTASSGADELVVSGADHTGISILAPAAKRSQLYFNDDAFLRWVENDGVLSIDTSSSSSKISLAPSGAKVGINVTDPAAPLNVVSAYSASATTTAIKVSTVGGYNATSGVSIDFGNDQGNYATWLTGQIASRKDGGSWQGSLVFSVNNNSSATDLDEKLKITSSLTTLSSDLQVGNSVSGQTKLVTFNSEGGAEVGLTVKSRTNRAKLRVADNDTSAYIVAENSVLGFGAAAQASANNFNILSSGFAALGTTAPSQLLHLAKSNSNGLGPVLMLDNTAGGTTDSSAITFASFGNSYHRASITCQTGADPYHGELIFSTGIGAMSALTERMRISSLGVNIPSVRGVVKTYSTTNKISNGDFSSTSNWTLGSGWVLGSGVATFNTTSGSNQLTQQSIFTAADKGKTFKLTFTVGGSGVAKIWIGNMAGSSSYVYSGYTDHNPGTYTVEIVVTDTSLAFWASDSGSSFNLDKISCYEQLAKLGDVNEFSNRIVLQGTDGADGVVIKGGENDNVSPRLFLETGTSGQGVSIMNESGAMQFRTAATSEHTAGGVSGSASGTKRAIISSSALYPNDPGYGLGLSNKRWLIYGTAGDFSGNLTFDAKLKGGTGANSWNPTVGLVFDAGASTSYDLISVGNNNGEHFNVKGDGSVTLTGDLTTGSTANNAPLFQNIVKSGTVIARLTANRAGGDAVVGTNSSHNFLIQRAGTTKLTVSSTTVAIANNTEVYGYLFADGASDLTKLQLDNSSGHNRNIDFTRSATGNSNATARIQVSEPGSTHTSNMKFYTSNASGSAPNLVEAMRINESQHVSVNSTDLSGYGHFGVAQPAGTNTDGIAVVNGTNSFRLYVDDAGMRRLNAGSTSVVEFNPSSFKVYQPLTVGANGSGHDVRFWADNGKYWEWDESDELVRQRDGVKTTFGDGTDLMIWHDGSNSYQQQGSNAGNLNFTYKGGQKFSAIFKKDGTGNYGAVELFYDGSKKFETTSAGSTITGRLGINTAAPTSVLHVTGDLGNSAFLAYLYNSGTQSEDNGLNVQIASSGTSAMGLRVNTGGDASALIVTGAGKTGLGKSPSQIAEKFTVGNGNIQLDNGYGLYWNNANTRIIGTHGGGYIQADVLGTSGVLRMEVGGVKIGRPGTSFSDPMTHTLRGYSVQYDSGGSGARLSSQGFLVWNTGASWTGNERMWAFTNAYKISAGKGYFALLRGDNNTRVPTLGDAGTEGTGTTAVQYWDKDGHSTLHGKLSFNRNPSTNRATVLDILDPTDGNVSWSTFLRVGRRNGHSTNELELKSQHDGSDAVGTFGLFMHGVEALAVDSSKRLYLNALPPSTYAESTADDFVLGHTGGHAGMTIRSGTAHAGSIYFADGVSTNQKYRGYIEYNHANELLTFGTSAIGRLKISSGGVGIGIVPTNTALDVQQGSGNILRCKGDSGNTRFAVGASGACTIEANTGSYALDITNADSGKGGIRLADSVKTVWGSGDDLQMYFDGTDGYIKNHVGGALRIRTKGDFTVQLNASDGGAEDAIKAINNGAVELYYDSAKKIATASNSVDVYDHFRPYNNNTYTCGTAANRWNSVYSVGGNFSGAVTAGRLTATNDVNYRAANISEINSSISFRIIHPKSDQTKAIAMGCLGSSNTDTGIQCYDTSNNSANTFSIQPFGGSITFNSAFTFPTTDGSADQVLKTNGSGTLSWADQSGGGSGSGTVSSSSVTTSTTNGNIAVYTASTTVKQAPRLFYNGSDHSLTINKTSPGNENLHVVGDAQITTRLGVGTTPNSSYSAYFNGAIYAYGDVGGTSKSFKINHPTKEGMKLRHSSLEGPEIGVYQRGEVQGDTIDLPDYWAGLVRDGTVTVQLTPKGSFQQLYVISASNVEVKIGEANGADIDCYYTIYGERADVERYDVEYEGEI